MGRITRIQNLVNDTIDHYAHTIVVPRGLPSFADPLLRGTIRFGKRSGNNIAVINVDNTFRISSGVARTQILTLQLPSQWLVPDCILSVGPDREVHQVRDIINTTILLYKDLNFDYQDTDKVVLSAVPLVVFSPVAQGDTSLTVKSQFQIANGDTFAYLQTDDLIQSLTLLKVTKSTYLGNTADPVYPNLYYIQLEAPIQRALSEGVVAFLKAFPAYFSSEVRVPSSLLSSQETGPFLIDHLSARLYEGKEYPETLAVKLINRSGGFVLGSEFDYVTISKNYAVFNRPLHAHYPLFWTLDQGVMRITPDRLIARVNPKGLFRVGTRCVPPFASGQSWRLNLRSTEDCTIRFYFKPYGMQEFSLVSGVTKSVTITVAGPDLVTDIEINITADTGLCDVLFSDWSPTLNTVDRIQYTLVVEATGIASYQSTGLVIKPYFLSSDFLGTKYDLGAKYDNGKIYL